MGQKRNQIIACLLILQTAYCCTSNTAKYKRSGDNVTLQFHAIIVHPENPSLAVSNILLSPNGSQLLMVAYRNGNFRTRSNCSGCTFTGDTATGNLSVRLDNLQASKAGTYKHAVTNKDDVIECVTVYILGVPTKPTISVNKNPDVGESVTLTCTSTSTTIPSNHSLSLTYTWRVDSTFNPSGSRYTYSSNKRTLTLSSVEKEDSSKQFTCTATEDISQGYTSTSSDPLSLTVLYGPDNLTFNPADTTYTREENTTLGSVTCVAECNPVCTFKWTKIGQGSDISNSAVLSLGNLTSSEAGTYRCTATRGGTLTRTKDLTVSVIYGPRRMFFMPTDTSYREDEHILLPPITCGSECWDCEYSWTGPNSYTHKGPVLSLGNLSKSMAGSYTCTARNIQSSQQTQQSKEVKIEVRYGPDTVSLSPQTTSYTVDEGSTLNDIHCSADCFPACTYRWTKGQSTEVSQTDTLSLGMLEKSDTGRYTCTATNGDTPSKLLQRNFTVTVRYGPYSSSTQLSPSTPEYTRNDGTVLSDITCSADCYPNCTYTWTKAQTSVIKNDGILALGTLNSDEAAVYMCTARNPGKANSPTTSIEVKVNVRYGPDALYISVQSPYTVTEGEPIQDITCSSDCYPGCSISWKNETAGSSSSGGDLTLGTVNRYMAGLYTCTGKNTAKEYAKTKEKNVTVIVNYPPDVHAFTKNTTNETVLITCNASGIPNSQYKYGKWIHKWPGTDFIVKEYNGSSSLVLDSLTYEYSGDYSCSASNGVKVFGTDKEYMEGSVQLLVKSYPIILNVSEKVSGRLEENVTIQIDYYSNYGQSDVKCSKYINRSGPLEALTAERYDDIKVDLPVFSHSITTDGTRAFIIIGIKSKEDFGLYDVVVTNDINAVFQRVEIIPRGPPRRPWNVTIDKVKYESASLSWIPGYHGGAAQTFVVEVSTDLSNWEERITVFGGLGESEEPIAAEVRGLHGSTKYHLRIYAFNEEGNSSFTTFVNFTTPSRSVTTVSSALIGGVAGGVSGVVVIVIAVVAVVLLRRRKFISKGKERSSDDTSDRKPVYKEEDSDYGMQDNPMYVSAGPRNDKQATSASSAGDSSAEYSTVNKTKPMTSTSTGVYAEVDRTKKNKAKQEKKQKHEKSKQGLFKDKKGKKLAQEVISGDIYENASATELQIKKTKPGVNSEPVYENPEPAKNNGKKNVNKDGLIYADLAFNDQPKGQRKLVIHGLDDMTEYVQVDFTKKADPLPDSDDESSTPKN